MGGRRTLNAGDDASTLTPPTETQDSGASTDGAAETTDSVLAGGSDGPDIGDRGTGFAALTGAESEIAAQQDSQETAENRQSEAAGAQNIGDVPAIVRAAIAEQLPDAVDAYFKKIGAEKPAERDAMLDDDAQRRRIDELVQASIATHNQSPVAADATKADQPERDPANIERDEAAEAAHKAEAARHAAEEKSRKAREREDARRLDEAEAAFASAQASSSDAHVTPDQLDDGGFAIRLEAGGRFAPDIAAIEVTRDRFSWNGGQAIYGDPIVLDPDVEPARIDAAWLIGNGVAKRCEIPNGIAAGGGLTAQLPGGSLAF